MDIGGSGIKIENWLSFMDGPCKLRTSCGQLKPKQGRLQIWTEHSTLILLISIPFEVAQQKFQHFYNLGRNEFSPNFKGAAQKLEISTPNFHQLLILTKTCFVENFPQKPVKLPMDVAGLFLQQRPPNLVRIHFFLSCKNVEIFVMTFQVVFNLAKISVSVLSIP